MESRADFDAAFAALTGHSPLGWQRRLYEEHFVPARLPGALDIPTGLGKTSVIVIWLLALAHQAQAGAVHLPRRLVYVVNRRTVVDQATDIAERLRETLRATAEDGQLSGVRRALSDLCFDPADDASPLAISTLRGEFADNREWQADPARAAIIVGTVDMIGSRLLLSGYGASRRMRPFHAGLLGHDALLVHDEAHLTPAFGTLVRDIARRQRERSEPRPLQVFELSATQRTRADDDTFRLDERDRSEEVVGRRLSAAKTLVFVESVGDAAAALEAMVTCAMAYAEAKRRILIYVRSPKDAKSIAQRLAKLTAADRVGVLTGTIRGWERDELSDSALFKTFRADANRPVDVEDTQYLVATSAGEVGIDLDADHLVCDLATLDSMIQRLGRVNRLGRGDANIHVIDIPRKARKDDTSGESDTPIVATRTALRSLPARDGGFDASPAALRALATCSEAFAKAAAIVPLTDVLLDNWSLTRVESLPGRPPVERWLHGITSEPPSIYLAWRWEVDDLAAAVDGKAALKTLFDRHPILARERIRGSRDEVIEELKKKIAKRMEGRSVIFIPSRGDAEIETLGRLLAKESEDRLRDATIVLPPDIGGLDDHGMLDGSKTEAVRDVADVLPSAGKDDAAASIPPRMRVLLEWNGETEAWTAHALAVQAQPELAAALRDAQRFRTAADALRNAGPTMRAMRETGRIILATDEEGAEMKALVLFAERHRIEAAEASQEAGRRVELEQHNAAAWEAAVAIVKRLKLAPEHASLGKAVERAAAVHDLGKNRPGWQKAIGNAPPSPTGTRSDWTPLAKSDRRGFDDSACGRYRHEFGSLREASAGEESADGRLRDIVKHPERDLILHLIAAHHGWARPHFEESHWDIDPTVSDEDNAELAAAAMRRFARLQRQFGHWGLAWLEALMRSADYRASAQAIGADGSAEEGRG
jgi:CRISPR-associated endonuclease/helicase Cas3